MPQLNLIGQKFGKLTVVSRYSRKSWNCICDCGTKIVLYQSELIGYGAKSCGCLHPYKKKGDDDILAAKKLLYKTYKKTCAKNRGHSFDINFEEFIKIVQKNCFYCGRPPHKVFRASRTKEGFISNGIDRLDNSNGYEKNNIVACCWECNSAKSTLTRIEFLTRIKKCYEHLNLGNIKNAPPNIERGIH